MPKVAYDVAYDRMERDLPLRWSRTAGCVMAAVAGALAASAALAISAA